MYAALATLRNGYMQLQWSRVQMTLVFNTITLPIVFGSAQTEVVKFVISITGVGVHLFLLNATVRADGWLMFLDERFRELEDLDDNEPSCVRVRVFSHARFTARRHSWFASRRFYGVTGVGIIGLWIYEAIRYGLLLWT